MREGKGVHCQKVCLINVPLQGGRAGGEEEGAPFCKHAKGRGIDFLRLSGGGRWRERGGRDRAPYCPWPKAANVWGFREEGPVNAR